MDDLNLRMLQLAHQGYTCSQILFCLALEEQGLRNPDLVRAMAGLAYGCGAGRASCGTLTGACCLLAFWAGGQGNGDRPSELLMPMLQELSDWFEAQVGGTYGGISCEIITGEAGPAAARQRCGAIVADTYAKVMEILAANGLRF